MSNKLYSYEEMRQANRGAPFSAFDYLHAIFTLARLPADFANCFMELVFPMFSTFNGKVFLASNFSEAQFEEYSKQGLSPAEIQTWINLVEITAIFDSISMDRANDIAKKLSTIWNLKLVADEHHSGATARVIVEEEAEEVFLTIDEQHVTPRS